jgi:hypothetical protein
MDGIESLGARPARNPHIRAAGRLHLARALSAGRSARRRGSRSLAARAATITLLVAAMLAGLGSAAAEPALAAGPTGALAGMWHRLNPQQSQSNPTPEHEVFACHQRADIGGLPWACRYFKIPAPQLNFAWNTTTARFEGADVTASWVCPDWFPATICDNVVQVVEGEFVFDLASGGTFSSLQDLVVTQVGGEQRLYDYWVNSFVCPWFRTFDEALAANPFPLPFDGVNGPSGDCVVAS